MQKISIGVTTYNRNRLLKRAVKSILNQSYQNYEILIGNDFVKKKINSKSLGFTDSRIKIYNHQKNLGEVENMNFLLNKSKSKWFTWLADDDFLDKDFLRDLYNNIHKFREKKIVASYSNYRRVSKTNKKKNKTVNYPKIYDKFNFIEDYCSQKIRLIGVYGLIKSNILKKIQRQKKLGKSILINGKPSGVYAYTDTMLPIRLSEYGKIIWYDKRLVNLDLRFNAISKQTKDYQSYFLSQRDAFNLLINIVEKKSLRANKIRIYKSFLRKILFNKIDLLSRQENLSHFNLSIIFAKYSFILLKKLKLKTRIILFNEIIKFFLFFLMKRI